MGRAKGFVVSEETKRKAKDTRIKNKIKKKYATEEKFDKVDLQISGKEKDGFDFWPILRNTLRPIHQYILCKKIEKEIVFPKIWQSINEIKAILENYFNVKIVKNHTAKYIINNDKRSSPKKKEAARKRMQEYWNKKKTNASV